MSNTIERKISTVNDALTERLDDLETQLPSIPSKALAATRSSVRRVNDVVEATASSIWSHFDAVGKDASTAVSTSAGQARAAAKRSSDTIESGVRQTTGQARAAVDKTTDTVKKGVTQTTGQARAAVDKTSDAVKRGVSETTGQARAAVESTTDAVRKGVAETTGQARTNVERSVGTVKKGVSETTGQVAAQAERTVESAKDEIEGALDDAKVATEPDDLAEWSKADLYERAQELDIEGRSGMTKAELIGAIQKA